MNLRSLSGALAGTAVLLLLVLQVLPWAHVKVEPTTVPGFAAYGFSSPPTTVGGGTGTATTWNMKWTSGNGASRDEGWYSSDMTDGNGGDHNDVYLIRTAIPLLLAGAALGLAGALVTLLSRGILGPVLGLAAALLVVVGTVVFANGADEFFEGIHYTWLAGFYVAVAACALSLAGGVVGLVGRNEQATRTGAAA
jgi:hypothetical protein